MRKQWNEFTCGPISIYNALRSDNKSVDIKDLIYLCNTDKNGTFRRDINKVARIFFKITHLRNIPNPWKGNRTYIISVIDWEGESHVVTLIKSTEKMAYVTNWYNKKGKFCHTWISWKTLRSVYDNYAIELTERNF